MDCVIGFGKMYKAIYQRRRWRDAGLRHQGHNLVLFLQDSSFAYVYLKGGFYIHVQLYSLHLPMKGRRMKRERYLFQFTSQVKCDSKRAAYYIDKL